MRDSKHHIARNLESAKVWIDQAEQSFKKDSDVRGELSLLLAQAELQRVREVNSSRRWHLKFPLLRHALALTLAIAAVAGGWYWWEGQTVQPPQKVIIADQTTAPSPQPLPVLSGKENPPAVSNVVAKPPAQVPSTDRIEKSEDVKSIQAEPSQSEANVPNRDSEVRLAPDEMQKLIRAAGKSLRGQ